MKKHKVLKWALSAFIAVLLLFVGLILIIYTQQNSIVQKQLDAVNQGFKGKLEIGESHLALFENFPYLSLKIDDVRILEAKTDQAPVLLDVADIYVGFNFWDLATGNYDIQSLIVEDGLFDIATHADGTINIANALATETDTDTTQSDPLNIHLKRIELRNITIYKRQEVTKQDVSVFIDYAIGGFETNQDEINAHVDTEFVLDVISNGDTTYFSNKHFEFHTDLSFNQNSGLLIFKPSGITMEHGDFDLEGSVDTKNQMTIDLAVKGTKPSFDMFIAFAPTELIPVLERYENAGNIYFNATAKGPTTLGRMPYLEANFGASEAYLENTLADVRLDQMGFSGYFTNGTERNLSTMEFSMKDIAANLEEGKFIGAVSVRNFEAPDIEMTIDADFDLNFWAEFLSLEEIQGVQGEVEMHMKFHDIIDLDNPQAALEELNQAYYAELKVEDLSLESSSLPAPLKDLDLHLEMEGKQAVLDQFEIQFGNSNLALTGYLTDLPAIVHHTAIPVQAHLEIESNLLDFAEITKYNPTDSTGFNEKVKDLKLAFSFDALGNAFTEFKYLPKGEFFIDDLYADLQNYPHTLHDFHADVFIREDTLKIVDFTGNIDTTDFHFNGVIKDYSFRMQDDLHGEVSMDITLKSDLFRINDLFTYNGENYVPEDYRHEEVEKMELHIAAAMEYDSSKLSFLDIKLDKWAGKMHVHPLRFEDFSGGFRFEKGQLDVSNFKGTLGNTSFNMDLNYFLGKDESNRKNSDLLKFRSPNMNFDELFSYQEKELVSSTDKAQSTNDVEAHASSFNIFNIPFPNMEFDVSIDRLIYHRYDLRNFTTTMRTTKDHFLYLDTLHLEAAGGSIAMSGYFNGSNPKRVYLKPKLKLINVDLDQLLFKFENFGQDALVSENLHGRLSADIWGNIRVYPDLVPDLDQSEVHLDALILDGSLTNYEPMLMLSDYFGDRDLTNVRFDTIQNHLDITNGTLSIPAMNIESTLGHMELSGTQTMTDSIDYFMRIPWSLVKEATKNKLFGSKERDPNKEDEIVEVDPDGKTRYLNINVVGTMEDYKVRMRKPKKKKK